MKSYRICCECVDEDLARQRFPTIGQAEAVAEFTESMARFCTLDVEEVDGEPTATANDYLHEYRQDAEREELQSAVEQADQHWQEACRRREEAIRHWEDPSSRKKVARRQRDEAIRQCVEAERQLDEAIRQRDEADTIND